MAVNDLAGVSTYGPLVPEQLLAGDMPVKTSSMVALATMTKYSVVAITSTGLALFVSGTHNAAQAAVLLQDVASGAKAQYAYQGVFNDALLAAAAGNGTLYAAAAHDTFLERQAFFTGLFRVGQVGGGWAAV